MVRAVDFEGRPFHFIGIGGIGMSGLARILTELNLPVSGSDVKLSHITEQLQNLGIQVFSPQKADNLQTVVAALQAQAGPQAALEPSSPHRRTAVSAAPAALTTQTLPDLASHLPQVICSTAIQTSNEEYQAAVNLGCPIFHRSDVLSALITRYKSIAVAGTHGKTTTSSMIGHMLYEVGVDPTLVIGGEVSGLNTNARLGDSDYLVAEADESDGSLVKFQPHIGIITNIELDHPDHYEGLNQLVETFHQFAAHSQLTLGCLDCPVVKENLSPDITYSLDPSSGADYSVDQVEYSGLGTVARVWERGQLLGTVKIQLLGHHNLSNALAAIATGRYLGLDFEEIAAALSRFIGVRRRFEYRGSVNGITLVDDYAHHPSEIQVTLAAARLHVKPPTSISASKPSAVSPQYQRVVAIFQPHRYSRTQALLEDFAQSFGDADMVVLCDIYSAGEVDDGSTSGQELAAATRQHHPTVHYCSSLTRLAPWLVQNLRPGDLTLFLGAGNLNQTIPVVLDQLQSVA
jgi:UDP-N-acetylmuramate--alanine ligase